MFGETPDFGLLSIYLGVAILAAVSGYSFFQKARGGFADVL
jgi:ABC-type polysaccharide/polyol phosphate export permease